MFGKGKSVLFSYDLENLNQTPTNLKNKITELTGKPTSGVRKSGKNKGLLWDI
jgi:hypothetical protein